MDEQRILIGYDGSDNAKHAIREAAALLGGGAAEVVYAWEPRATSGLAGYALLPGAAELELEDQRARAEVKVAEGAAIARAAGFDADATAIPAGGGTVWGALCAYADSHRTRLIVVGTRGLTGVRSALAGSVSHGLAAHAHVPVLVVPPKAH